MNITPEFLAQYLHLPIYINPQVDNSLFSPICKNRRGIDYEQFRLLFNHTLDLPNHIVIPLTSGWDTRTILSALLANKHPSFHCFTAENSNEGDVLIAAAICSKFNISHTIYKSPLSPVISTPANQVSPIYNPIPFGILPYALSSEIGIAPDNSNFIFGSLGNEFWRASFEYRVRKHITRGLHSPEYALFKTFATSSKYPEIPDIYTFNAKKILMCLIKGQLQKAPLFVRHNTSWLSDWFVWQNYHCVPTQEQRGIRGIAVFQHPDLVKFILQISPHERKTGNLQRYIISTNCPSLMEFPFNPNPVTLASVSHLELPPYSQLYTKHFFDPIRLSKYLSSNPNPYWVESLASLEMRLSSGELVSNAT